MRNKTGFVFPLSEKSKGRELVRTGMKLLFCHLSRLRKISSHLIMFPCGQEGGNLDVFFFSFHINYSSLILTPLFLSSTSIKAHLCISNESEENYFLAWKHMDGLPDFASVRAETAPELLLCSWKDTKPQNSVSCCCSSVGMWGWHWHPSVTSVPVRRALNGGHKSLTKEHRNVWVPRDWKMRLCPNFRLSVVTAFLWGKCFVKYSVCVKRWGK